MAGVIYYLPRPLTRCNNYNLPFSVFPPNSRDACPSRRYVTSRHEECCNYECRAHLARLSLTLTTVYEQYDISRKLSVQPLIRTLANAKPNISCNVGLYASLCTQINSFKQFHVKSISSKVEWVYLYLILTQRQAFCRLLCIHLLEISCNITSSRQCVHFSKK